MPLPVITAVVIAQTEPSHIFAGERECMLERLQLIKREIDGTASGDPLASGAIFAISKFQDRAAVSDSQMTTYFAAGCC